MHTHFNMVIQWKQLLYKEVPPRYMLVYSSKVI